MNNTQIRRPLLIACVISLLGSSNLLAHGQGYQDDDDGYGMMHGSDMMDGHGMMHGSDMMDGHGMMHGSDMMDGHGMMHGSDMMDGYGMMHGSGMMGSISPYMQGALGLSDEQQRKTDDIQRKYAKEHWKLMQQMHSRGQAMMRLYDADDPEPEALKNAYLEMSQARGQMIEQQAKMHREMNNVLTEQQKAQHNKMRRFGRYND